METQLNVGLEAVGPADRNRTPARYSRALLYPAALLTLGAAIIHASVVSDHLQEYLSFGLFFVGVAVAQVVLAGAIVLWPGRKLFAWATVGTLAVVALYVVSRSVGLPFGPSEKLEGFRLADPLGMLLVVATANGQLAGLVTTLLELVTLPVFALLWLSGPRVRHPRPAWVVAIAMAPVALLVVALTAAGARAEFSPLPYAVNMSTAQPGQPSTSMAQLVEPSGLQPLKTFTLTAQLAQLNGQTLWTYNGAVPGPELHVNQGDRVRVTLINHLPAATTIHWHGLRLPDAEDGVAGLTQHAVPPGATYTYEFVAKDLGTYWYHSHQEAQQQVPLGLYGALIVAPTTGTSPLGRLAFDRDLTVIVGDANSSAGLHLEAQPGERVRLRIVSAFQEDMTGYPELLVLLGAPYRVIALDGHELNQPQTLGPQLLPIGSGQRYDLAFQMPATGQVRLLDLRPQTGNRVILPEWVSLGQGAVPPVPDRASLATFDLTHYGLPAPDPVASRTSFDVTQDLTVTSQPGIRYGAFQNTHLFNRQSFPNTPTILVSLGQTVELRFINDTDEYHPMHLHGHYFSVISKNGQPLTGSPVHLDTVLVGPHETWVVAFVADNPGLWMLHCHVLIHAAYGLSAMVSYTGISTPYTIGTLSGDFPE
jgi:FtsP/CotA-like multicopper oxidase with cupredoxin domain